jgi:hypothetical protein
MADMHHSLRNILTDLVALVERSRAALMKVVRFSLSFSNANCKVA